VYIRQGTKYVSRFFSPLVSLLNFCLKFVKAEYIHSICTSNSNVLVFSVEDVRFVEVVFKVGAV
jgi:hypothetical protein